jgi:pyrroloquinoline quinone (PQQ) biosynthesis protein C
VSNKGKRYLQLLGQSHTECHTKLGKAILDGNLSKSRIQLLAKQVYLQEKWPSHIAHVYLNLDEEALANRRVIKYILSIIRAENLGVGSGATSHTELAGRFAVSVGVSRKALDSAQPIPSNRMLMDWCDMSALDRPWIEAFAVHIACESQVQTMKMIGRGLQTKYGISAENVQFWTVHGGPVERSHMANGLSILADHLTPKNMASVEYAYRTSCQLLSNFYDSILEG